MFSYVFMKLLEKRPHSYDRAINTISAGRIHRIKEKVAATIIPGSRVLEIGCGTGELAVMMLAAGAASVEGFDESPAMAAASRERIEKENLKERFSVRQMGVDAMDALPPKSFDAVVATLVVSELSDDERRFTFKHACRILQPRGVIVIASEVVPRSFGKKILHTLARAPVLAITYLASGNFTRPVADLAGDIRAAGFSVASEDRSHGDAFAVIIAVKKEVG